MKCRFVIDVDVNPDTMRDSEREKIKRRTARVSGRERSVSYFPAGTEYECNNAAFFVHQGMAEPADRECEEACGLTTEDQGKLQRAYQIQALGIGPDDRKFYEAGYMLGYNSDARKVDAIGNSSNTWIPGPKFEEYLSLLAEAEEDDDE